MVDLSIAMLVYQRVPHWVLAVFMQGQLRSDLVAEAETPPLPWELTRLGARAAWRAKQMAENSDALQGPVMFGAKRILSSWLSWSMLKFSKFEDVYQLFWNFSLYEGDEQEWCLLNKYSIYIYGEWCRLVEVDCSIGKCFATGALV